MIRILTFLGVMGVVALTATSARAQSILDMPRADRPYRGLFGGGTGRADQLLTVSGDAGVGYDTNIWVGGQSASPTGSPSSPQAWHGGSTNGSASLAYSLRRKRASFVASANSGFSYYSALQNPLVVNRGGGWGATFMLSKNSTLDASQSLAYQPYYALASFPGLIGQSLGQPLPTYTSAILESHRTSMAAASLRQRLSRRVEVSFSFNDNRSRSSSGTFDISTQSESAGLSISLAKGLAVRAGYGSAGGSYGATGNTSRVQEQTLNAGLDFNRALSVSRRLTLSFASGSSGFKFRNETRYFLTGDARLTREIGRTWSASLAFTRRADLVDSFRQPVISDAVAGSFGGLVNRKVQFQSGVGVARGDVGFAAAANGFHAYYATAGFTFGLTRLLALNVNYAYSRYAFEANVSLPLGLSGQMDRQSVHASLNVWLPLIQRTRSSNVAR